MLARNHYGRDRQRLLAHQGVGVDADPKNDPTYPMKTRNNREQEDYSWECPPQQPFNIEVLRSIERPNITAAFGTSTPPSGLSGMIRCIAFKYSESGYGHWLPLMLADRVNAVEGVLDDLKQGHVSSIFEELGWKAEWQHNRKSLVRQVLIRAVVTSAAIAHFRGRRRAPAPRAARTKRLRR